MQHEKSNSRVTREFRQITQIKLNNTRVNGTRECKLSRELYCICAIIRNVCVCPSEPSFKQVYQCACATLLDLKETNFAFQLLIKLCILMFVSVCMFLCPFSGLLFIMPPKQKNSLATQQPPAKHTHSPLLK